MDRRLATLEGEAALLGVTVHTGLDQDRTRRQTRPDMNLMTSATMVISLVVRHLAVHYGVRRLARTEWTCLKMTPAQLATLFQ